MSPIKECIISKQTHSNPVWFMRQAGRYLPEFMKIRKKNTDFIKLCLNSDLSKEITIQPLNRFDLDAAIIFSDILMIPYGLGQEVKFKKGFGPSLSKLNLENIINATDKSFINNLKPVYKAIEKVKKEIKNKSLIGFVGAPWTLLLYMINGTSPKKNFDFNKIVKDKKLIKKLKKIFRYSDKVFIVDVYLPDHLMKGTHIKSFNNSFNLFKDLCLKVKSIEFYNGVTSKQLEKNKCNKN